MKVLYLTYDGLTDPLGGSQILPYLVGLSKKGTEITVISCEKQAGNARRDDIGQVCHSSGIKWIPLKYHKSPPIISTMIDRGSMLATARKELRNSKYQIIHCRSYIPALIGLQLKRRHSVKFVFDMRGFWADERVEGGLWNLKNPIYNAIYKYFKKAEKTLLAEADYTISLTRKAADYLRVKFKTGPIQVIPCCVDLELFDPAKTQTTPRESFTIGYLGSLGTWYMIPEMLEFFKVLLVRKPESVFLVVTQDDPSGFRNLARELGIPEASIRVHRSERKDVPGYIAQMDWCIMFIKPVFSKTASSPTKLGEVMAMDTPILCNSGVGDMDSLLHLNNAGHVVDQFTQGEYQRAVDLICDDNRSFTGSRALAESELNLHQGVEMYWSVYQKLAQN